MAGSLRGIGPKEAKEGDSVVILHGFDAPTILRKHVDGYYTMIGSAYVSGLMDFKLLEALYDEGKFEEMTFEIC